MNVGSGVRITASCPFGLNETTNYESMAADFRNVFSRYDRYDRRVYGRSRDFVTSDDKSSDYSHCCLIEYEIARCLPNISICKVRSIG